MTPIPLPPDWLIRGAVAAVWLYEGILVQVAEKAAARIRSRCDRSLFRIAHRHGISAVLGRGGGRDRRLVVERIRSHRLRNSSDRAADRPERNGLLWARRILHDPAGMIVKNFAFLVLVWVSAGLPDWT